MTVGVLLLATLIQLAIKLSSFKHRREARARQVQCQDNMEDRRQAAPSFRLYIDDVGWCSVTLGDAAERKTWKAAAWAAPEQACLQAQSVSLPPPRS